jgi:hypothetical protein
LNLPLVITVQSDGATNLDRPAPVCFPNLPDPITGIKPGPGEKSALWSFNHDAGQWEIVGHMTVTADGNFVKSDAGVGIRQPGWHGAQPGSSATGGDIFNGAPMLSADALGDVANQKPFDLNALPNRRSRKDFDPSYEPEQNGCGAKGGAKYPDVVAGVSFKESCNTHDTGYGTYSPWPQPNEKPIGHKASVDSTFYIDLQAAVNDALQAGVIDQQQYPGVLSAALAYYVGVTVEGGDAYQQGQLDASVWITDQGVLTFEQLKQRSNTPIIEITPAPQNIAQESHAIAVASQVSSLSSNSVSQDLQIQRFVQHFLIEDVFDGNVLLRGKSTGNGLLTNSVILPPKHQIRVSVYQPNSASIGTVGFSSKWNGETRLIPGIYIGPHQGTDTDTDTDTLSDESEAIVGTDPNNPDTDNDGVTDGAELKNGTDPLSGIAAATGIVGKAETGGDCRDVAAVNDVLAAACGAEGLQLLGVR